VLCFGSVTRALKPSTKRFRIARCSPSASCQRCLFPAPRFVLFSVRNRSYAITSYYYNIANGSRFRTKLLCDVADRVGLYRFCTRKNIPNEHDWRVQSLTAVADINVNYLRWNSCTMDIQGDRLFNDFVSQHRFNYQNYHKMYNMMNTNSIRAHIINSIFAVRFSLDIKEKNVYQQS